VVAVVIRVVVVDDHALVRQGLQDQLDTAEDVLVVATAADGLEALEVVREHVPDVVLMDLSMPRMDGIAATRAILAEHPRVRVVALTSVGDAGHVRASLQAGVVGYHLKDFDPLALLAAVRAAADGRTSFDPRVAHLGTGPPGQAG
jgi:DNA-binding NarL/FixJ family response regulator